jgi:hypothetical protein
MAKDSSTDSIFGAMPHSSRHSSKISLASDNRRHSLNQSLSLFFIDQRAQFPQFGHSQTTTNAVARFHFHSMMLFSFQAFWVSSNCNSP